MSKIFAFEEKRKQRFLRLDIGMLFYYNIYYIEGERELSIYPAIDFEMTPDILDASGGIQGGPQGAMAPQTMDKIFFTLSDTNHW